MVANAVCEKLRRRRGVGIVRCQVYEGQSWRTKNEALAALGFIGLEGARWEELTKDQALDLLIGVLSEELCYRMRIMSKSFARELATEFLSVFHWQSRFFTGGGALDGATLCTGVLVRTGDELTGVLWVGDID